MATATAAAAAAAAAASCPSKYMLRPVTMSAAQGHWCGVLLYVGGLGLTACLFAALPPGQGQRVEFDVAKPGK